jgi:hypothetical protein
MKVEVDIAQIRSKWKFRGKYNRCVRIVMLEEVDKIKRPKEVVWVFQHKVYLVESFLNIHLE